MMTNTTYDDNAAADENYALASPWDDIPWNEPKTTVCGRTPKGLAVCPAMAPVATYRKTREMDFEDILEIARHEYRKDAGKLAMLDHIEKVTEQYSMDFEVAHTFNEFQSQRKDGEEVDFMYQDLCDAACEWDLI